MVKNTLKVTQRKLTGRKVKTLRSTGLTPGNIFGKDLKSINVSFDTKPFQKLYSQIGESSLLYLQVESEKEERPVFIKEIVKNPVTGQLLHVSFHQVNLKEKVTAPVPVELVGESPAEKDKLGILVQQQDEIEISALPTDMPENIQIDVSSLSEVGSNISVKDLKLDSKLAVETDPDTIIVQIEALAKEEVEPAPVAAEAEGLPAEAGPKEEEALPTPQAKETSEKSKEE